MKLLFLSFSPKHYSHCFLPNEHGVLALGLLTILEPLALFPYLWRQVESKFTWRQRETLNTGAEDGG